MDAYACPECGNKRWLVSSHNGIPWKRKCPYCGYSEEV
jgi:DNA-directed RNA polymerase subunit RPC12/RpoP